METAHGEHKSMKPETISIGQELKLSTKLLSTKQLKLLVSEAKQDIIVVFYMWITRYTECIVVVPDEFLVAPESNAVATKWVMNFSPELFSERHYHGSIYNDKNVTNRLTDQHSLEERLAIVEAQLDNALDKLDKLDRIDDKLDSLISHLIPQRSGRY